MSSWGHYLQLPVQHKPLIEMKNKLLFGLLFATTTAFGQAGACDLTFDPGTGANSSVNAIALQPDGKILIGGAFYTYNGEVQYRIARLNHDGSLDPTFDAGAGPSGWVHCMALQPDGKILIGGDFMSYDGIPRSRVARLNSDGSLDSSFNPGTGIAGSVQQYVGVSAIAVQPDGKILVGGSFMWYDGTSRDNLARINSDGSLDPTFDTEYAIGANSGVRTVVVQPDGKILFGEGRIMYELVVPYRIRRLNSDGGLDLSFDPGTGLSAPMPNGANAITISVNAMAIQPDGKVLVGGKFRTYNDTPRNNIARINNDGSLDPTFDPGTGIGAAQGFLSTMALQPDGKILIGGTFTTYNGTVRNNIARVNSDGSLDLTFNPGTGANGSSVGAVALQPDGKIMIGGSFSSYNGVARKNIARIWGKSILRLLLTTDAFGSETTWELSNTDQTVVSSGGPYADGNPMEVMAEIEVDPGCYTLRVYDAGGNGITDGGYVLTDANGQRIIDANGNFASLSSIGTSFCFPLGPAELDPEDCDDTDHSASDPVTCNAVNGAIGYQFLVFDPHGSYQARTTSTWPQVGPNRLAQVPVDLELNVRVRAMRPDSSFTKFGPTCTFMIAGPGMAPQDPKHLAMGNESELMTWPNPTQGDQVQLTLGGLDAALQNVQVQLYDATGRQAFATALPVTGGNLNCTLELGTMAQGIYLVQLIAGEEVHSARLVVGE